MADLDTLITLATSDKRLQMSTESATSYFKGRVLPQGNCIVLYKDTQPVAACAALTAYKKDISLIRFTALAPDHESAQLRLYIELAKHLKSINCPDKKLMFSFSGETTTSSLIKALKAKEVSRSVQFRLEEKPKE